jgi:hypothetical protein
MERLKQAVPHFYSVAERFAKLPCAEAILFRPISDRLFDDLFCDPEGEFGWLAVYVGESGSW